MDLTNTENGPAAGDLFYVHLPRGLSSLPSTALNTEELGKVVGMKCELGEVDTGGHGSGVSCFLDGLLASPKHGQIPGRAWVSALQG